MTLELSSTSVPSGAPLLPEQRGGRPAATAGGAIDPATFKSVFRRHPAGVTVVTLTDQDGLVGFTATSVISVSASPPLLAFSVANSSSSWPSLSRVDTVVINFLGSHQSALSARFATSGIDRFAVGGWQLLATGEPVIADSASWIRGRIINRTPVGASHLITVEGIDAGEQQAHAPLLYHDRAYHQMQALATDDTY